MDGDEMGKWISGEKTPGFLEQLRENTRDHGTKGGVLEKGCIFFERYLRQPLEEETRRVLAGRGSDDFFDFVEGMSFTISLAALRQSYRLAGGR